MSETSAAKPELAVEQLNAMIASFDPKNPSQMAQFDPAAEDSLATALTTRAVTIVRQNERREIHGMADLHDPVVSSGANCLLAHLEQVGRRGAQLADSNQAAVDRWLRSKIGTADSLTGFLGAVHDVATWRVEDPDAIASAHYARWWATRAKRRTAAKVNRTLATHNLTRAELEAPAGVAIRMRPEEAQLSFDSPQAVADALRTYFALPENLYSERIIFPHARTIQRERFLADGDNLATAVAAMNRPPFSDGTTFRLPELVPGHHVLIQKQDGQYVLRLEELPTANADLETHNTATAICRMAGFLSLTPDLRGANITVEATRAEIDRSRSIADGLAVANVPFPVADAAQYLERVVGLPKDIIAQFCGAFLLESASESITCAADNVAAKITTRDLPPNPTLSADFQSVTYAMTCDIAKDKRRVHPVLTLPKIRIRLGSNDPQEHTRLGDIAYAADHYLARTAKAKKVR